MPVRYVEQELQPASEDSHSPCSADSEIGRKARRRSPSPLIPSHKISFGEDVAINRRTTLLLLEILADGTAHYPEMSIRDLLHYVQRVTHEAQAEHAQAAASGTDVPVPPMYRSESSRGSHKVPGNSLHPRDLRKLSTPFGPTNVPVVMVRRHVVLLNFDPLRAVVLHDRVVVLVPEGADSILDTLQRRLSDSKDEMSEVEEECSAAGNAAVVQSFAFRAIEAVLAAVLANLETEFRSLEGALNPILKRLQSARYMNVDVLSKLRVLKDSISGQEARANNTKSAILGVLDEDEDMALMHLQRQLEEPDLFQPTLAPEVLDDHESFELLFEIFMQGVGTVVTSLELLRLEIANAEAFNVMKLDTARNHLLTAEIIFSLVSMCAGIGSFVAGVWGMNLRNGHENDNAAFKLTVGVTVVSVVVVFASVMAHFFLSRMIVVPCFDRQG